MDTCIIRAYLCVVIKLIEIDDDIPTMHRAARVCSTVHAQIKLIWNNDGIYTDVCPHRFALHCVWMALNKSMDANSSDDVLAVPVSVVIPEIGWNTCVWEEWQFFGHLT